MIDIFFFYWYGPHRHLHSFPTRRSSDLSFGGSAGRSTSAGSTTSVRTPSSRNGVNSAQDRKSTRLNSSHANISYAVFCLKKKKSAARALTGGRDRHTMV